ncbi:MAG: tetratricopeptide repeat protein [Elsteraceae bacterium]
MSMEANPTIVTQAHSLYYAQGRRAEALALLEAELARYPNEEETEGFLAFLYATEGRYLDALRLFTRLIDRNPLPRYMSNIFFCRTAAAGRIMDGLPINGDA